MRRTLFQVIVSEEQLKEAQIFVSEHSGFSLKENVLFAKGIDVAPIPDYEWRQRVCTYYPALGQVHWMGRSSFGSMLSVEEYRNLLIKKP